MKLLDPNEIKEEKYGSIQEAHERVRKLSAEESRLALRINIAREDAKKEIEKIDAEVEDHRKLKKNEKDELTQEIESLREQKQKLLQPIEAIKTEAEVVLVAAQNLKSEYEGKIASIEENNKKLRDEYNELNDRKDKFNERECELGVREEKIIKEEMRLKESVLKLADDRAIYYKIVIEHNKKVAEVAVFEETLKTRETILEIRQKEQDMREADISGQRKEIRSGYAALEQAKIHLGIKT